MKNTPKFSIVVVVMWLAALACGSFGRTNQPPGVETEAGGSNAETATLPPAVAPSATPAGLEFEILQLQSWTDRDGNVRVNVLARNPYDFPVVPVAHAALMNAAGERMRGSDLYFLDGISGGGGFFLPGETIAATACFTCEKAPLTEEWASVTIKSNVRDGSESWQYVTEVEVIVTNVSFEGDSPLFDFDGSVKNNSDVTVQRISARVFVYDQAGNFVGAGEASGWDVAPGASVSFNGYGIGQAPDGPVTYETSALGVNY
jgi:hypothetical protein